MTDLSPFTPFTTSVIAGTTAAATVALSMPDLPGGVVCRAYNGGSATAFVAFGDSTVVASSAGGNSIPLATLQSIVVQLNQDVTHASAKTLSGSGTIWLTTGQVG